MHLYAILFVAVVALHLFSCAALVGEEDRGAVRVGNVLHPKHVPWRAAQKAASLLRVVTKPLIMPCLALWYAHAAAAPEVLVIIAMALGCVGDIFLLFASERAFLSGMGAFGAGHVCYIFTIVKLLPLPSAGIIVLFACLYLVMLYFIHRRLIPYVPKRLRPAMLVYSVLLASLSAFGLLGISFAAGKFLFFGGVLFAVSDYIIARRMFIAPKGWHNLVIMATYCAAQFLLMQAFLRL